MEQGCYLLLTEETAKLLFCFIARLTLQKGRNYFGDKSEGASEDEDLAQYIKEGPILLLALGVRNSYQFSRSLLIGLGR